MWDGVSFTPDGIPDIATLIAINDPHEYINNVKWMPDGRLVIVVHCDSAPDSLLGQPIACSEPSGAQVFLWDWQTLQPVFSGSSRVWVNVHDNGSLALLDFDGLRFWGVTIFDNNLQPVFQSHAPHTNAQWSADGNLAYCVGDDLWVWDGQDSTLLSSSTYAQWLRASPWSMVCTTG